MNTFQPTRVKVDNYPAGSPGGESSSRCRSHCCCLRRFPQGWTYPRRLALSRKEWLPLLQLGWGSNCARLFCSTAGTRLSARHNPAGSSPSCNLAEYTLTADGVLLQIYERRRWVRSLPRPPSLPSAHPLRFFYVKVSQPLPIR